ncbi:hypothetical protein I4F81_005917 [Pyropia yezoensis]|uniref:Uncharacterized protein n=1 Tax=Pyropia yezoensis TaxID=2788 RepID=A0ACC3C026_PYRYE|nr:hypothetical protein I4F81_005917 [Neopyropia yezoensis]
MQAKGAAVVASTGLPGVGKSLLAVKWANMQAQSGLYNVVAWLRAEHISDLEDDLVGLGNLLGVLMPASPRQSRREQALSVKTYLEARRNIRALLVFDNAKDHFHLRDFVPVSPACHSLFTARDMSKFPTDSVLPLKPFEMVESMSLLQLVSQKATDGAARRHAMELCGEVGHLPLAVHALASYTRSSGLGFADVLSHVQGRVASARAFMKKLPDYAGRASVIGAMLMVLGELGHDDASLASLNRLALLAPDRVPRGALLGGAETDRLYELGIVSYSDGGFLAIHRLVQSVALELMESDVRERVANELLADVFVYMDGFAGVDQETWEPFRVTATHAEALLQKTVIDTRAEAPEASENSARWNLLARLRDCYIATGALPAALRCSLTLKSEVSSLFPPTHRMTLSAQFEHAGVLLGMGKHDEALVLYRAVEEAKVAALGEGHPEMAATRHNIAGVLEQMGKYDEALVLYRAVEEAEVAALGEGHPSLATTRHSIAGVLKKMGKYNEALVLYRAVEDAEVAALGEGHPSLATTRHGIAGVLKQMGKYNEALVLYRAVEGAKVAALGEGHPSLAATRHNIAGVLKKMGKYNEALVLYRAVEDAEVAALGEGHPSLATTRHNIAGVLKKMGKYNEALVLYRAVEEAEVAALGEGHPSLATTRHNIAGVLKQMGKYNEALVLYRAVEGAKVAALGEGHLSLASTRHNIAGVLKQMGKYNEALVLYRAVEGAMVAALGEGHPSLATTRHGMAGVLEQMGKYDEALVLYRAVEEAKVAALGEGHPSLATTRHSIAGVLEQMG